MRQIFFIASVVLLYATPLWSSTIGDVIIHEGNGAIERETGEKFTTELDLDVFMQDTVKTGNGTTAIKFLDDTRVDVTKHSKLIIDEFVYDPNTQTGGLTLKAALGTVKYASGQIAKTSKQNIKIQTPTATIGVRGTDFTMTIDEVGSSTIILLPSCDTNGNCYVGEISVESDAGQVIMNQAFQATVVDTIQTRPLTPVILDLDIDMISNLLIISEPREIEEQRQADYFAAVSDALDVDFLKFDELEKDYLEEEADQWSTMLDIDFLDMDLLPDVLAQINAELKKEMEKNRLKDGLQESDRFAGVKLGKDPETGITVLMDGPNFVWTRSGATSYIELRLDTENTYILNIVQGDYEIIDYELGEGQENEIIIDQSD